MAPIEAWPKTREGWHHAWTRFGDLEAGRAKVASPEPAAAHLSTRPDDIPATIAESLLSFGIVLQIAGLFPGYLGGASLAGAADQLALHAFFLAGFAVVAATLMSGHHRYWARASAFGIGLSALTLGFFLSDFGQVAAGTTTGGPGFTLSFVGWGFAAVGIGLAAASAARHSSLGRPTWRQPSLVVTLGALGLGTAATFAPSWDRFHLLASTTGQSATVTAGNVFSEPGAEMAANLLVMALVVVAAVLAASWTSRRIGALVLGGALVPMVGQLAAAVAQLTAPPGPSSFGISGAQAARTGLQITAGLTPAFYLYTAFIAVLVGYCVAQLWPAHPTEREADAPSGPTASFGLG